jgi:hypothetical protein
MQAGSFGRLPKWAYLMPKSRGRTKRKGSSSGQQTRVVKLNPQIMEALKTQREAFRKKFGRDPGPGDPMYFDRSSPRH